MPLRGPILAALAVALVLPGCTGDTSLSPTRVEAGFEDDLAVWEVRSELTGGATRGGWSIDTTGQLSTEGAFALNLTLDARQREGAIWVDRRVQIDGSVPYEIRISVDAWSPRAGEDPHARLLLRVGADAPGSLAAFPQAGDEAEAWGRQLALDRQPGWRTYEAAGSMPAPRRRASPSPSGSRPPPKPGSTTRWTTSRCFSCQSRWARAPGARRSDVVHSRRVQTRRGDAGRRCARATSPSSGSSPRCSPPDARPTQDPGPR